MKIRTFALILLCCGVLGAGLALGIAAYLRQNQSFPHIACEAMRPLVFFNGITYVTPGQVEQAHGPSANELGPVVAIAGTGPHDVQYDCALLAPGQQVYSINNYASSFRLAVKTSTGIQFFEVGRNPQAKTGAALFDINGKVLSAGVSSLNDPGNSTALIQDPVTIQKLVGEIAKAPVTSNCSSGSDEEVLLFHLKDGSVVATNYWPKEHTLGTEMPQCVNLPQDFAALLVTGK